MLLPAQNGVENLSSILSKSIWWMCYYLLCMFFFNGVRTARKQMLNGLSDAHLGNCGGWAADCRSMCLHVVVDMPHSVYL